MTAAIHRFLLASGRFFFRVRNGLFPTVLLVMVAATRPTQFLGNPALDEAAMAVGALLLLSGEAFRVLVIGYAYIRRGGRNREVSANQLVTRGFYRHTRNPMYVGNFSIVLGFTLIYGSAWGYAVVAPFFAYVYLANTTAEEEFLRGKFGAAYEEYTRRVNRFIPDPRGLSVSLSEFAYDWRRALIKEYGTIAFTLMSLLLLFAWKIGWVYGYTANSRLIQVLGAMCLPVLIFYGIIRYLKKSLRLRAARKEETELPLAAA
jgi:protein-S-isoprenylcysteine O-methyltransferase Ste14